MIGLLSSVAISVGDKQACFVDERDDQIKLFHRHIKQMLAESRNIGTEEGTVFRAKVTFDFPPGGISRVDSFRPVCLDPIVEQETEIINLFLDGIVTDHCLKPLSKESG